MSTRNRIFTTSQLAQKLGVGPSMARRYGLAFEETTGQSLPQAPGKGRLYPEDVTKVLLEARERLLSHPEDTVEGALRVVLDLEEPTSERIPRASQNVEPRLTTQHLEEALTPILEELKALRRDNQEFREEIQSLKALPRPQEEELDDPNPRLTLLERRNAYLEGELKRRDAESALRKSWWPWGRK